MFKNNYVMRLTNKNRRVFHMMEQCPIQFYTVYPVSLRSPYKYRIDLLLRWAQEHGLLKKWENEGWHDEMKTTNSLWNPGMSLSTLHLAKVFFLYVAGCGLATLTFFIEYMMSRKQTIFELVCCIGRFLRKLF